MDGVLTDFDRAYEERFGIPPKLTPRPELWEKVLATENYWLYLPKKNGADILLAYLNRFGFSILTGLPVLGYAKAEKEKRLWLKKHYNKEDGVICCLSKDKQNFGTRQDILIDDLKQGAMDSSFPEDILRQPSRTIRQSTVLDRRPCALSR